MVEGEGGTDEGTVVTSVVDVDELEEDNPQPATTIAVTNTTARPSERQADPRVRKVSMSRLYEGNRPLRCRP